MQSRCCELLIQFDHRAVVTGTFFVDGLPRILYLTIHISDVVSIGALWLQDGVPGLLRVKHWFTELEHFFLQNKNASHLRLPRNAQKRSGREKARSRNPKEGIRYAETRPGSCLEGQRPYDDWIGHCSEESSQTGCLWACFNIIFFAETKWQASIKSTFPSF